METLYLYLAYETEEYKTCARFGNIINYQELIVL